MELTDDDVFQILKYIRESNFEELKLEIGDLKLVVTKQKVIRSKKGLTVASSDSSESMPAERYSSGAAGGPSDAQLNEVPSKRPSLKSDSEEADRIRKEDLIPIISPILGIFYSSPKPGAPPFVEVGTRVTEDDTVCIIEVMKLFTSIKAGARGRIVKICAENGQMVKANQTLFLIDPKED